MPSETSGRDAQMVCFETGNVAGGGYFRNERKKKDGKRKFLLIFIIQSESDRHRRELSLFVRELPYLLRG